MNSSAEQKIITQISQQIEIPAQSDYYIKFDETSQKLVGQTIIPASSGLSETVIKAIAKSPTWIQRELISQFQVLHNSEEYADMLLNASKQYTDEIAFSIACSPLGTVPTVHLLQNNVQSLYAHDQEISYADIIDYDDNQGNYSSTIRYAILEEGVATWYEYPPEIYYWYVVHPKLQGEIVETIYDIFWRDYLYTHNDLGYPLLKEKLSNIQYLWDRQSYCPPANRLWSWSRGNHPTAIEAISYWIGKTVPAGAFGDRPGQPNIIAHEHNGWCGELQRLATAVQRTMLIPTVGACNVAEDHVWREFYEQGWHEADNWWTDSGGAVDEPDIYAYGWGKNMSSIYSWRGDDTIYDITSHYIHPQDRITVKFVVKDAFLKPVDGARITVTVKGLKDITYYKNLFWSKVELIWDKIPDLLKGKLLQSLYGKLQERVEQIPDVIDGLTISIWNYTNTHGECSFELGKNLQYLFVIQEGDNLRYPWRLARHNALRVLTKPENTTFHVLFPDISNHIQRHTVVDTPSGECSFNISFTAQSYQLQKNLRTDNIGRYKATGNLDCFIVDQENFEHYTSGKKFTCIQYLEAEKTTFTQNLASQDWYIIFRNHAQHTNVVLDVSLDVRMNTDQHYVQITTPATTLFDTPTANIGDIVLLSGIADEKVWINLDHIHVSLGVDPINGIWSHALNTTNLSPGTHVITVSTNELSDEFLIKLIDVIPPKITTTTPTEAMIIEKGTLLISGHAYDTAGISRVDVALDDNWRQANGTTTWSFLWNLSDCALGMHTVTVKAIDTNTLSSTQSISFVLNESGHTWKPEINQVYHTPENPTNMSNIIIHANVSSTSPFPIKNVILNWHNGAIVYQREMYQYGDYPIQERHEEDPLFSEPNTPLFGYELGQLLSGETISYWIVAYDMADNQKTSDVQSLTVV